MAPTVHRLFIRQEALSQSSQPSTDHPYRVIQTQRSFARQADDDRWLQSTKVALHVVMTTFPRACPFPR